MHRCTRYAARACFLLLLFACVASCIGGMPPPPTRGVGGLHAPVPPPPRPLDPEQEMHVARFILGFRHYDTAQKLERTLRQLWDAAPHGDVDETYEMGVGGLEQCLPAPRCSHTCSASSSRYQLDWHIIQRDNAAAQYPTDFLLLHFTRKLARGSLFLWLPDEEASLSLRMRAGARLRHLVAMHPHTLKYAQEDVRLSRALFNVQEEEDEGSPAEEQERRTRIEQVQQARKTAPPSTTASAATTAASLDRDAPHRPIAGGVGDFPAPQRFDLSRTLEHVSAAEAATQAELDSLSTSGAAIRRKLCQWGSSAGNAVAELLQASKLWSRGFTGAGIRIAIFDTGLSATHAHFRNVDERTNWTDEPTLDDGLGHGTFVAGVIASAHDCLGFAPDARLHIFRVFNQRQLSFTSWFLDAFNYAIHSKVHVLNLSIGGPDFMDKPFVDKVNEMSANGITVVSAIGNDGPLWGTLNNPADQMDVIGVGGITEGDQVAPFSSRGMTTWELPSGYGRIKPDLVALARNIRGSAQGGGCKTMSGTSVASPVVAGCVTLLASVVPEAQRASRLNPAYLKQLLLESSSRVGSDTDVPGIFEQGAGKFSLLSAFDLLTDSSRPFVPHASLVPSKLDLSDCPYMWPYCTQPLYHSAQPIVVNMTVLNSQAVASFIPDDAPPRFFLTSTEEEAQGVLQVWFSYPDSFWPWSGFFAVHLSVRQDVAESMQLEGFVVLTLETDDEWSSRSTIRLPLRVDVIPTPPRARRLLFDAFHSLRYPSGYFPRDNLEVKSDTLDWNGDHIHTNYRELYTLLRGAGYYVEVLGRDYTCLDARRYGVLLLIDPEEEYFAEELVKLHDDVYLEGLSVLVMGDWYNAAVMREIKFFDENTAGWWTPETGGANVPALNQLLAGFGMGLSDHVVKGEVRLGGAGGDTIYYASGSTISRFPEGGMLSFHPLHDGGSSSPSRDYAIYGGYAPAAPSSPLSAHYPQAGRVFLYGDSNCVDMNHRRGALCGNLVLDALDFLTQGAISPRLFKPDAALHAPYADPTTAGRKPRRVAGSNLVKYSKVISPGSAPACPLVGAENQGGAEAHAPSISAAGHPSALSYASQHSALRDAARAAAAAADGDATSKATRFHSSIQKLAQMSKEERRKRKRERAASPDETDLMGEQRRAEAEAAAAAAAEAEAEGGASTPTPRNPVLTKQARLSPVEDGGSWLQSDGYVGGSLGPTLPLSARARARRDARLMWLWAGLLVVIIAIVAVGMLYRRQRRMAGKHSPSSTPIAHTRSLQQPHFSPSAASQRVTLL